MFRRTIALMLTVLLGAAAVSMLVSSPRPSRAEDLGWTPTEIDLDGSVLSVAEDSFMLLATDGREFQVNTPLGRPEALSRGDAVRVTYNGAQTRSIPAQIVGLSVLSERVEGTVLSVTADGFVLACEDGRTLDVISSACVREGGSATVWLADGEVLKARGEVLSGTVVGLDGSTILLENEQGLLVEVLVTDTTLRLAEPVVGEALSVAYGSQMTLSEPAQLAAFEIF